MVKGHLRGLISAAILAIAVAVPAVAATPGSRITTIQLTFDVATGTETFVGRGPGICPTGIGDAQNIEFFEYDDAFSIRMTRWLVCDDGSGSIQILLSVGGPADGYVRQGGWAIIGGTDEYEHAVGGGTLSAANRYPGDVVGVDTMTGAITK